MKHIDKEIYNQPNINKRLKPLSKGYWISAAVGVVSTLLYFGIKNASAGLSYLMLGLMLLGDFMLLIVVCYHLFGDSRGPYCKECHGFLNREFNYYPRSSRSSVEQAMGSGSIATFKKCRRGTIPEVIVVRYYDDDETLSYCQMLEQQHGKEVPQTEVVRLNQ